LDEIAQSYYAGGKRHESNINLQTNIIITFEGIVSKWNLLSEGDVLRVSFVGISGGNRCVGWAAGTTVTLLLLQLLLLGLLRIKLSVGNKFGMNIFPHILYPKDASMALRRT
jgi:hypothetical protein